MSMTYEPQNGKLDPIFKKKWINALRSGQYLQGKQSIRRTVTTVEGVVVPTYCCLGVALDIIDHDGWVPHLSPAMSRGDFDWRSPDGTGMFINANTTMNFRFLPETSNMPNSELPTEMQSSHTTFARRLANMNDVEGAAFDQIADWIEANL